MTPPRAPAPGTEVGIRALREEAATYVRRAADGHRIVVTVSGEPVAQLGPLAAPTTRSLNDLVAVHAVLAPRRRGPLPQGEPVSVFSGTRLDRLLNEIR